MGKIIEGLWDCPFCGNKRIRAGQKTCPDCGHPQDLGQMKTATRNCITGIWTEAHLHGSFLTDGQTLQML